MPSEAGHRCKSPPAPSALSLCTQRTAPVALRIMLRTGAMLYSRPYVLLGAQADDGGL